MTNIRFGANIKAASLFPPKAKASEDKFWRNVDKLTTQYKSIPNDTLNIDISGYGDYYQASILVNGAQATAETEITAQNTSIRAFFRKIRRETTKLLKEADVKPKK